MPLPALTLENVSVEKGGRLILEKLNAVIESGCLTAVMGPNGAGKTTLLHAILGLVSYSGRILFGKNGTAKRPRIGYVPQRLDLDRGSPITVRDFLSSAQTRRPLWTGISKAVDELNLRLLDRVGVAPLIYYSPMGKISGGETQRVLLVQALLGKPEILLLDEPAAAVDVAGEALFCDVLDEVQREMGLTTLLVSHDLSIVTTHARNVLCLNKSLLCSGPIQEVLTPDNLRRVFSPHVNVFDHNHTHPAATRTKSDGLPP